MGTAPKLATVAILFALAAEAQTPVPVEYKCTDDDIQLLGQNCSDTEPCPVYLELSGLDVSGSKIFITGNIHTETSTLASILLASADGGKTWMEPHPRIPNAGLDQIQFFDFETGWIAGQMLLGTPKDPFLLITRDGGKTWRAQPLFEESHPGMIERFWFDSRTTGWLLIDRVQAGANGVRHELYETMTGGDGWMLRQAGASPIALKNARPGAANSDWRLSADVQSKTNRLEHQEGSRWVPVALFPVRAGQCKPPERAEVAAPESEAPAEEAGVKKAAPAGEGKKSDAPKPRKRKP